LTELKINRYSNPNNAGASKAGARELGNGPPRIVSAENEGQKTKFAAEAFRVRTSLPGRDVPKRQAPEGAEDMP